MARRRSRAAAGGTLALAAALGFVLSSCSSAATTASSHHRSDAQPASLTPARVTITPPNGAADVPLDTPVSVSAAAGRLTSVTVQESGGATPPVGRMTPDSTGWQLGDGLDSDRTYVINATAVNGAGQSVTSSATFTTLRAPRRLITNISPGNGSTVGVGEPIDLTFNTPIPDDRKAALLQRIQVSSTPGVLGAWHWFGSQAVHFRTETYWPAGTKVSVTASLKGFDAGNGVWGLGDWATSFSIGPKHVSIIDDLTHQMQVYSNDQLIDTFPVSMGKPGFPTLSGTLVVLYKLYVVKMASCGTFHTAAACVPGGANYYDENVYYDTAISTNGFYIHAAPWSVYAQGHYDVSHGCVNLSTPRAITFFNFSQIGDVVIVLHTPNPADITNGEADWQIPFTAFTNTPGTGPVFTGASSSSSSPVS